MWRVFVAFRYLRRRLTTYIAVAGVAIGVMVLVIVMSVMGGFQREFHEKLRGINAHMTVRIEGFGLTDWEEISKEVSRVPGVAASAPFIQHPVLIKSTDVNFGFVKGIDPLPETGVGKLREYLLRPREAEVMARYERLERRISVYKTWLARARATAGVDPFILRLRGKELEVMREELADLKPEYEALKKRRPLSDDEVDMLFGIRRSELPGLVIGVEMMKYYNLRVGDTIQLLTTTQAHLEEVRRQNFVVLSAFKTGIFDNDFRFCYGLLEEVRAFIGCDGVTGLSLRLDDYSRAGEIKDAVREVVQARLPGEQVAVRTWEELNKTLLQAVRMEKWLLGFIIFFIVVVAGFGIVAILTMMVSEKTRDIGILKALGGSTSGVMGVFLIAGLTIALAGSLAGLVAGLAFVYNINEVAAVMEKVIGYHPFPREVYYLDRIPTEVDLLELAGVILPTLAMSLLFALYPAVRAARLEAVEALRYE